MLQLSRNYAKKNVILQHVAKIGLKITQKRD